MSARPRARPGPRARTRARTRGSAVEPGRARGTHRAARADAARRSGTGGARSRSRRRPQSPAQLQVRPLRLVSRPAAGRRGRLPQRAAARHHRGAGAGRGDSALPGACTLGPQGRGAAHRRHRGRRDQDAPLPDRASDPARARRDAGAAAAAGGRAAALPSGPVPRRAARWGPLKSMLRHVLETGIRRDIHFYWGARHVRDLYEEPLVLEWVRRHTQLTFTAVLSEATALEAAHHRVGWVHEAVLADYPDLERFEVYAAGPPAMIEAMRASFPRHGLPPERLYFDSFDYAPDAAQRASAGR